MRRRDIEWAQDHLTLPLARSKDDRMIETIEKTMTDIENAIEMLLELRMDMVMLKYHSSEQKVNNNG